MKMRELKVGEKFRQSGSEALYAYRGSGWYSSTTGCDGGPWHQNEAEDFDVELVRTYDLRLRQDANAELFELPVIFSGDSRECDAFAESKDFQWKNAPQMIFGGYYVNSVGDCLILT